jgi:hypothetical protein
MCVTHTYIQVGDIPETSLDTRRLRGNSCPYSPACSRLRRPPPGTPGVDLGFFGGEITTRQPPTEEVGTTTRVCKSPPTLHLPVSQVGVCEGQSGFSYLNATSTFEYGPARLFIARAGVFHIDNKPNQGRSSHSFLPKPAYIQTISPPALSTVSVEQRNTSSMTRKPSETWPEDKWRDPSDSQEIEGPQCQQPYQVRQPILTPRFAGCDRKVLCRCLLTKSNRQNRRCIPLPAGSTALSHTHGWGKTL